MLHLKNIEYKNELYYADCYREDEKQISFTIVVNPKTEEIQECSQKVMDLYVSQALYRLCKLYKNKENVKEASVVWC